MFTVPHILTYVLLSLLVEKDSKLNTNYKTIFHITLYLFRSTWTLLTADNAIILNVNNAINGGVNISLYVQLTETSILSINPLKEAIKVYFKLILFELTIYFTYRVV